FLARILREQIGLSALRAGLCERTVPCGELALGIIHAPKETLAEAALPLSEPTTAVGTDHALQGDRPRRLASRIIAARQEATEAAPLVHHRLAAGGADLAGGQILDHLDLAALLDEVLGALAIGVSAAGEEPAHPPTLAHHRAAALLADQIGRRLLA